MKKPRYKIGQEVYYKYRPEEYTNLGLGIISEIYINDKKVLYQMGFGGNALINLIPEESIYIKYNANPNPTPSTKRDKNIKTNKQVVR